MILCASLLLMTLAPKVQPPSSAAGQWAGTIEMAGSVLQLSGWIESENEGLKAVLHLPQVGAMAVRFEGRQTGAGQLSLTGSIEGRPLLLEAIIDGQKLDGHWSWSGQGGPFELTYSAPLPPPYSEHPVSFRNDGVELSGTVLLPRGPGPFAAVVWAHGSGGVGRRSRTYVREPYVLAQAGVASLIYDKRGVGESTGDWRTSTFEELAMDAVAARTALSAFETIDMQRVGVGGISQASSWIAPLACRFDPDFAFALILSATGRIPSEQHLWVVECRLRNAGFGDEEVSWALDLHRRLDHWQRYGGESEELDAELDHVTSEPWFASALLPSKAGSLPDHVRSWMWLDPLPIWKATEVIAFACWGSADQITNPEISERLLTATLGERLTTHLLPGAGHGFEVGTGPPPRLVAPGLHPLLLDWMRAQGFMK